MKIVSPQIQKITKIGARDKSQTTVKTDKDGGVRIKTNMYYTLIQLKKRVKVRPLETFYQFF